MLLVYLDRRYPTSCTSVLFPPLLPIPHHLQKFPHISNISVQRFTELSFRAFKIILLQLGSASRLFLSTKNLQTEFSLPNCLDLVIGAIGAASIIIIAILYIYIYIYTPTRVYILKASTECLIHYPYIYPHTLNIFFHGYHLLHVCSISFKNLRLSKLLRGIIYT